MLVVLALFLTGCSNGTVDDNSTSVIKDNTTVKTDTKTESGDLKDIFDGRTVKYTGEYTISAYEAMYDITQAYDLPKFVMITMNGEEETRSIFDGTDMTTCTNTDDEWQCFKMAVDKPESAALESDVNSGKATTTFLGTCTFAGETGKKYQVVSEGAKSTVCYTDDGILLEMFTEPEYYIVAKKITRSVDSKLFVLPAEPIDLNAMMQNI